MNLADLLTYADIGQLNRIADHYECSSKTNSKHELIQSILITLGSKSFVEEQVEKLPIGHLCFLNALLFDPRASFSMEELTALARQAIDPKGGQPVSFFRDIIVHFTKSGWLFNGSTHQTRYLYQVPNDLKVKFLRILQERFLHSMVNINEPSAYRDEHHLLAEDLRQMLKFIDQYEIPLNQEGFMYRRTQQQLMEFLNIQESLLGKGGWRFGYGRTYKEYPDRLALLYDYAYHHRYVTEHDGLLELTSEGRASMEKALEEEMIQLFRFWLRQYKGAIPNVASVVYWIGRCAERWVTVSSLLESIGDLVHPFYYDSKEVVFMQRILQMLLHLGMIRCGDSEQEGQAIQMTAWGSKISSSNVILP
ncbi:hypothetical protein BK126_11920 [Paenibacillus sp. FSL H7-0326]|uniref:hypothetical protein n=1 Tax=Paenibacillus sp. FSL H7-0326 TaxID=1921144 RepID=UPI00096FC013|nr:hypothetical protein [Paenibacillus sp. FSL H7-0326]OMC68532.1 hypothetical protein BK126_11920 [Paenibacillus sp. FSL H7-0326]